MRADALAEYARDPVGFIDHFVTRNEKGRPWRLSPHQRRVLALAFRWDELGRLLFRIFLWSEMKKSGKTFLAACLIIWWAFVTPNTEVIAAANDLEQSVSRTFRTVTLLLKYNPELAKSATIRATEIILSNGTTIVAIASDYKGAAGARHSLVVFDELWGYTLEAAQRLYEELTPPPTEENAWVLIVTTAGWSGESVLLERLYHQGLAGVRLDKEIEVFQADELLMFWSHTPRQAWLTETYYAQQRRSLRPATYLRLHENRWVTTETTFITEALWDGCIDADRTPVLADTARRVYVGVDGSTKGDSSAVDVVAWEGSQLVLVTHRIWRPTPQAPLDLEATLEAYLHELRQRFHLCMVLCDPFQLHRSIMTLKAAGLPIQEFPQSVSNVTRMGQTLFDLLNGRNLRLYPSDELRQQALNTVAVETPRGFRIAKEKSSRKIDGISALAIACCAALEKPPRPPVRMWGGGAVTDEELAAESKAASDWLVETVRRQGFWFPGD